MYRHVQNIDRYIQNLILKYHSVFLFSMFIQLCHWKHILGQAWRIEGWRNKVNSFVMGPGWTPGKPRLGLLEDLPDVNLDKSKLKNILSVTYKIIN